jgi:hypothetical protein
MGNPHAQQIFNIGKVYGKKIKYTHNDAHIVYRGNYKRIKLANTTINSVKKYINT